MFSLQPVSNHMLGVGDPFVEVTGNSKEENSKDFCPNYLQEFGFRGRILKENGITDELPFSAHTFYISNRPQVSS